MAGPASPSLKPPDPVFSISRTIWPQNTKLSLEGVSKSKGIWISLWAPQHVKSLMLCKKLVCSSGTELPQGSARKSPLEQKSWNATVCIAKPRISSIFTSAGPKSLLCTPFPRPCPWQELSTQWHWWAGPGSCQGMAARRDPEHRSTSTFQPAGTTRNSYLEGQGAWNCALPLLFRDVSSTSLLVFYPKHALKQLDAKKGWT